MSCLEHDFSIGLDVAKENDGELGLNLLTTIFYFSCSGNNHLLPGRHNSAWSEQHTTTITASTYAETTDHANRNNSIQLMNDGQRWWVATIFWQGEDEKNPLPEKYLKN